MRTYLLSGGETKQGLRELVAQTPLVIFNDKPDPLLPKAPFLSNGMRSAIANTELP